MLRPLTVSINHVWGQASISVTGHFKASKEKQSTGDLFLFLCVQVCWSSNQSNQDIVDIVIVGKSSSLFLCVDSTGRLRGQVQRVQNTFMSFCLFPGTLQCVCCRFQRLYSEADCTFTELLLADGYTRFLSSHHGLPVSLASKQSLDRPAVPFTRFLPIGNTLMEESASEQTPSNQKYFNVDSGDLLGMGLNPVVSPQFSADK